jgi:hypothetical protein
MQRRCTFENIQSFLKFGYVIRFRGDIHRSCGDKTRFAAEWVGSDGRATLLR